MNAIERVKKALTALKNGEIIILTDHPDRENEGDLVIAAEHITTEQMNFIIRNTSGIVCLSITEELAKKLALPYMVPPDENTSTRETPFTLSIDAKEGITTGVSARDRVQTVLTTIKQNAHANDLVKPGHIFPLIAKRNGVLQRQGHTEGAMDLVKLAGLQPAAVLCELMNANGTMMHNKNLEEFAEKHQLHLVTIDDIIHYRYQYEHLITETATASLPLEHTTFQITVFKDQLSGIEHLALIHPEIDLDQPVLVRIHSACATGDLFASLRCDCHAALQYSLKEISNQKGILIYLNQEGRGIGLLNKIKTYALQDTGLDTVEANEKLGLPIDSREYYIAAHFLKSLGIQHIQLLTNNPAKITGLERCGFAGIERITMPIFQNKHNEQYLKTKKKKLHHFIKIKDE